MVAQRLLKVVCKNCSESYQPEPSVLIDLGVPENELADYTSVKRSSGCTYCNGTGTQGRRPVFEVFKFYENVIEAVLQGKTAQEIKKIAVFQNKMKSMRMNALIALKEGLITIDEVINVTVKDNL